MVPSYATLLSSIRIQLMLWYAVIFGVGAIVFSVYLVTQLQTGIYREFDNSLLHAAQAAASYFQEFAERGDIENGALETVRDIRLGRAGTAILKGHDVLAASDPKLLRISPVEFRSAGENTPVFSTDTTADLRIVQIPVRVFGSTYTVIAAEPREEVRTQVASIGRSLYVGLPVMVLLALLGGLLLSERALRPIHVMCDRAEQITVTSLDQRLPVVHPRDELGRLSCVINDLLARLEKSFQVMRSFMADASHELRTPLSVIQGEVDVVLNRERTVSEYQESLRILRGQAQRMSRIVNDLLALSRADAGAGVVGVEDLYLNDLVEECCRAAASLASHQQLTLKMHVREEDICVRGNEELLRRMIGNLIDNALRYTPQGGEVEVRLDAGEQQAILTVSDTGIGIPPEAAKRVFDRFFRVDQSRNRASGGAGLGLAIVKLAAESHNGSVKLRSEVGSGSTFTVEIPTA